MTEPGVTLTDYGLALECAVFAWLVWRVRRGRGEAGLWIFLFFASLSASSLFGGTVHGFFLDPASGGHVVLWPLTLLGIGVTALCGWAIGAALLTRPEITRLIIRAAGLQLVLYGAVVLFVSAAFWVAVVNYLPAALFLLVAFVVVARQGELAGAALGAWGLVLSFIAAAIQVLQISIHPIYFNHNSLYHAVQAVALALIFVGCRRLLRCSIAESGVT